MEKKKPTQIEPKKKTKNESNLTSELKASVIEFLAKYPIVQAALQKAGVPRPTYYKWRQNDLEFAELADKALLEGRLSINDVAESKLIKKIHDGETTPIIFWMKNNHPQYSSKVSLTLKHELPELDAEQLKEVSDAMMRNGLGNLIKVRNFIKKEFQEHQRIEDEKLLGKNIDAGKTHYPEDDDEIDEFVEQQYPSGKTTGDPKKDATTRKILKEWDDTVSDEE